MSGSSQPVAVSTGHSSARSRTLVIENPPARLLNNDSNNNQGSSPDVSDLTDPQYLEIRKKMEENGYRSTPADDAQTIRKFVVDDVWPLMKFITSREVLDSAHKKSLMAFVTKSLHIPSEAQMDWWNVHKDQVHQNLRTKRGNVTTAIKKVFIGKCYSFLIRLLALY